MPSADLGPFAAAPVAAGSLSEATPDLGLDTFMALFAAPPSGGFASAASPPPQTVSPSARIGQLRTQAHALESQIHAMDQGEAMGMSVSNEAHNSAREELANIYSQLAQQHLSRVVPTPVQVSGKLSMAGRNPLPVTPQYAPGVSAFPASSMNERQRALYHLEHQGNVADLLSLPGKAMRSASDAISSAIGDGPIDPSYYQGSGFGPAYTRTTEAVANLLPWLIPGAPAPLTAIALAGLAQSSHEQGIKKTAAALWDQANPTAPNLHPDERVTRAVQDLLLAFGAGHAFKAGVSGLGEFASRIKASRVPAEPAFGLNLDTANVPGEVFEARPNTIIREADRPVVGADESPAKSADSSSRDSQTAGSIVPRPDTARATPLRAQSEDLGPFASAPVESGTVTPKGLAPSGLGAPADLGPFASAPMGTDARPEQVNGIQSTDEGGTQVNAAPGSNPRQTDRTSVIDRLRATFEPATYGGRSVGGANGEGAGSVAPNPYLRGSPESHPRSLVDGTPVDVKCVWSPHPMLRAGLESVGISAPQLLEFRPTSAQAFSELIGRAKASSRFGAAVSQYTPAEYRNMRLFVTPDGSAGFALSGDNIVSVFKRPNSPYSGFTLPALHAAVQEGGRKLDAFDTQLPGLYSRSGFRPVAKLPFDPLHKPADWDYGTFEAYNGGQPDVVFMIHDPNHFGSYTPTSITVSGYDEGVVEQRKALTAIGKNDQKLDPSKIAPN